MFSHCPEWKMWQFSTESGTTNSTHFLLAYGKGTIPCVCTPYLSSVGYCIVYLIRVRHNLPFDKRNRLHTFFFDLTAAKESLRHAKQKPMEKFKSTIVAAGLGAFVPLTANAQSPSPEIKMVSVQGGIFTMGYFVTIRFETLTCRT